MILISILHFFLLTSQSAFAEDFGFSYKNNKVSYKVGNSVYRVMRVHPHQQELQHLQIDHYCVNRSKKEWIQDHFEFGLCEISSANFNPESRQLTVTYYLHDLEFDPLNPRFENDDGCMSNPTIFKRVLADKCTKK